MRLIAILTGCLLAGAALAAEPERTPAKGHGMVDAANPLAVEAGLKVLRQGGSAADAAVAVQATLGLVEPQSSGIGGGAFMVYYDARTHKVSAYDGREFAPAAATPKLFLKADGTPMAFSEAVLSGRSAGTPGAVAMLKLAQSDHGRLAWARLFDDSIQLADQGFIVSPRLAKMAASKAFPQSSAPDVIAYFTRADGKPYQAGDRLRNAAYAATLRRIAKDGPDALLKGPIAQHIVDRLKADPIPGDMTLADLAAYKALRREALCRPYRQWLVCTPGAPSGGVATQEGLGLLQRSSIATKSAADPAAWLILGQAERLSYADDLRYIGDPASVKVPTEGLLESAYLDARARQIGDAWGPAPSFGKPRGTPDVGPDATKEPGGTSSFVIVDKFGDVVCMTTTVESIFGDGRMVDGFFLNNQLTDSSFSPNDKDGTPAANAVGPRKRPRSSMSPTIVLDRDGKFVMAVGSPGGLAIPAYVLKTLVGVLDWKLSMQAAIDLPNLIAIGPYAAGETTRMPPELVAGLAAKGLKLSQDPRAEGSGLHGIIVRDGYLEGGADPRREGVARSY